MTAGQFEVVLCLHALALSEDLSHPDISWRDNTAWHKQFRRFLESIGDKFLTQVTEEPTKRSGLPDLILKNKERHVGDVEVEGSLACSDHGVEQSGGSGAKIEITTLDIRRSDFGLFRDLLERVTWDNKLKGRGMQEKWLILKDHLLRAQEQSIPTSRKSSNKLEELHGWTRSS
ncbi:glycerol kinase [Limosa lapponica baueri]|uniref:Glycerol kinase n=1 Tax=Limosa lapponica baueri TaxID=1758121 RepID=A0A2I0U4V9_LIMLA|nr:glycerol kinase [Limosa lapponica baueri]